MRDIKEILNDLAGRKCKGCGLPGEFCLEDSIVERRTWKLTPEGIGVEESLQEDAEPYFVSCVGCGHQVLPFDADDLQVLIDAKDAVDEEE